MTTGPHYTLTLSCPDRVGIVAAVSALIAEHRGWITEASHYADPEGRRFFMRQEIQAASLAHGIGPLREQFSAIARDFQMDWRITASDRVKRIVILVSQLGHCLYDLLARLRTQDLRGEVIAVLSNHEALREWVEWHGIPFHYLSVPSGASLETYAPLMSLVEDYEVDVIVLARYMQILPAELCALYPDRIINIHHSFLPGFVGARPYHQAYARGVKLIGATCHYATADLDQGPIIEQDVIRVDHSDGPEDLVSYGRDIEKTVLARGLRYHLEDRVLRHGCKTVVFR